MNNINLIGRITADLELQQTSNNIAVLHFTVAVPRPNAKDTTDFIRCVAWRSTAEFIKKYFHKGKMIAINGYLTSHNWTDEAGQKRYANEVLANAVEFCGDKAKEQTPAAKEPAPAAEIPQGFEQLQEEIPF